MTRQEALEHAQEIWLVAAVRDQRQFHAGGPDSGTTGSRSECAVTIAIYSIESLTFRCPKHRGVWDVRHFNDARDHAERGHNWDWLTLARKLGIAPYDLLDPEGISGVGWWPFG